MVKKLDMVFATSVGKTATISLLEPKADLTKAQVTAVMNQIIEKNIFLNKTGTLSGIEETKIRTMDEVALA